MSRPDAGEVRPGAGRSGRAQGTWLSALPWIAGTALVSVLIVWFLMPRAPDAFGTVGNALRAGPGLVSTGPGVSTYFGSAVSPGGKNSSPAGPAAPFPAPSSQNAGPDTPSPASVSPSPSTSAKGSSKSPRQSPPSDSQTIAVFTSQRREASLATFPPSLMGSDVAKAAAYSPTVAVEVGPHDSFAVAPAGDTGARSAIPLLLAAALIAALAWLAGAMFGPRRSRWKPQPVAGAGLPSGIPPGTEPVPSPELRRLRRDAQQRAALARRLAELVPSMPDALVWQAQKALAEAGVRAVVPDGEPFDANAHHAVGTEPVPPGGRENIIARTIRPGYADDGQILVYPKVVVYADDTGGQAR